MVHAAVVFAEKRTQAGQLAFIALIWLIVVLPLAFTADTDAKVLVEGAAMRRIPRELPAHALAKCLKFGIRGP
ncbi:hypothetical protein D3C71_2021240 [compost metagenome]